MKTYMRSGRASRFVVLSTFALALTLGWGNSVQAEDPAAATASDAPSTATHKKSLPCGGPSAIKCSRGMSCVDDPSDNCDPTKDGLNCPGTCVAGSGEKSSIKQPCGGPSRIKCIGGMICIDDPSDKCDPTKDGLDCMGMCVTKP